MPSELRLQYLNNIINCVSIPEIANETNENQDHNEVDFPEEVDIQDGSDWVQWSANMYDNAQRIAVNCTEETTIKACYNPNFAKLIKTRLIPYLVL